MPQAIQSISAKKIGNKVRPVKISNQLAWLLATVIIVFIAIIRLRLLQIPLERDEGEFAYMGQLMLQGIPPYLLAYNMKLPGIYAAYALVMAIFGQTIAGIHLGLMVVNITAIILLFLLTRRLFGNLSAIIAATSYAFLSLCPSVLGTSAHATQFIVPFALSGTIILLKALDSHKYKMILYSGLLYGIAFIIKQHAIFFIIFGIVYYIDKMIRKHPIDWRGLISGACLFLFGSAIPYAVICALLYAAGVFSKFWFWTFTYAHQYVSEISIADAIPNLLLSASKVINPWGWLWAIAGVGLTTIFWDKKAKSNTSFLLEFSFFSFLTICPGFYFRNNYFISMLPAVSILAGVSVSAATQFLYHRNKPVAVQIFPVLVVISAFLITLVKLNGFFFHDSPIEICRMIYGYNPFPESIEIAEYIKNHSTKNDKIAILGSEPQICFYANRKSATGYIYMYSLMESHDYAKKMQLDMIQEIENARPEFLVFINCPASWQEESHSDMTIVNWAKTYLNKYYGIAGIIDIPSDNFSVFWAGKVKKDKPMSKLNIYVLKRNGN